MGAISYNPFTLPLLFGIPCNPTQTQPFPPFPARILGAASGEWMLWLGCYKNPNYPYGIAYLLRGEGERMTI